MAQPSTQHAEIVVGDPDEAEAEERFPPGRPWTESPAIAALNARNERMLRWRVWRRPLPEDASAREAEVERRAKLVNRLAPARTHSLRLGIVNATLARAKLTRDERREVERAVRKLLLEEERDVLRRAPDPTGDEECDD